MHKAEMEFNCGTQRLAARTSFLPLFATLFFLTLTRGLKVAVLGNHNPTAWGVNCTGGSDAAFTSCNLALFSAAVSLASSRSVNLLVFPEAYALARLYKTATFEPFVSPVGGAAPCDAASGASPQQTALSCLARQHRLALAANFFVAFNETSRRIAEVVFDEAGAVRAVYFKHHLFPNEDAAGVTPGPFAPTTVSLLGRVWGIIICFEGVYPYVTGDFSQMDALVAAGATDFLWSVGGEAPLNALSALLAGRYKVGVIAAMDSSVTPSGGAVYNSSGAPVAHTDTRVACGGGYTGAAILREATL
jgi:predicted amidohydrolase